VSRHRYELGGDGRAIEKRWTSIGAAASLIGNGPPVVSALRPDGTWSVIYNHNRDGDGFPTVHRLAEELDRRRRELAAP
jgi:hypothetical protein